MPLDGGNFTFAIYSSLLFAPLVPAMPSLITAAVNGNADAFSLVLSVSLTGVQSTIATGLSNTIICTEEQAFVDLEEERALIAEAGVRDSLANNPQFNLAAGFEQSCAIWDLPAADPVETEPVVSVVPTLILTGEFDPITPPSYGELAVETLENGYAIEIPGASHDPATLAGPAGVQLIVDFLIDPTRRPDTSAIEQNQVDFSPEQWT
ncbi:MAG TPA: alpha/beta hydrolase [Thermomicrobiales bacterium]|nr:alpha/beta hydrolase [Thermomicrobiales bacterium]